MKKAVRRIKFIENSPGCEHRTLRVGVNDMATTRPFIGAQLHPTLNGDESAHNIFAGSHRMLGGNAAKPATCSKRARRTALRTTSPSVHDEKSSGAARTTTNSAPSHATLPPATESLGGIASPLDRSTSTTYPTGSNPTVAQNVPQRTESHPASRSSRSFHSPRTSGGQRQLAAFSRKQAGA